MIVSTASGRRTWLLKRKLATGKREIWAWKNWKISYDCIPPKKAKWVNVTLLVCNQCWEPGVMECIVIEVLNHCSDIKSDVIFIKAFYHSWNESKFHWLIILVSLLLLTNSFFFINWGDKDEKVQLVNKEFVFCSGACVFFFFFTRKRHDIFQIIKQPIFMWIMLQWTKSSFSTWSIVKNNQIPLKLIKNRNSVWDQCHLT